MKITDKPAAPGFKGLEQRQNGAQRINDLVRIFEDLKSTRNKERLF
jgi:hypothetical protein